MKQKDNELKPLFLVLCAFFISLIPSLIFQWRIFVSDHDHGKWFVLSDYNQLALNTFAGFAAIELGILIFRVHNVKSTVSEEAESFRRINSVRQSRHAFINKLTQVYEFPDEPIHNAARKALEAIELSAGKHAIKINSAYLSVELYYNFWLYLLEAQRACRAQSPLDCITVYLTHSTSVRLWDTSRFRDIMRIQALFLEKHGKIFRIMVNQSGGEEKWTQYVDPMTKMARDGVKTWYLEHVRPNAALPNDYMLVRVGDRYYTITWLSDWAGANGGIEECKVESNDRGFPNDHEGKWRDLLDELESKRSEPGWLPIISAKPAAPDLRTMRKLM